MTDFNHIYIERAALPYSLTQKILDNSPDSNKIIIDNYKNVFSRPRQRYDLQKKNRKLILAEKNHNFIYPMSSLCSLSKMGQSYYTACTLGCLYNCDYCYLRGKLETGNTVVFVNINDFFKAALQNLNNNKDNPSKNPYLAISYDTDLLAMEKLTGLSALWMDFAKQNPHITFELRTKSSPLTFINDVKPPSNVILVFTLSTSYISRKFEHLAPSLEKRVNAAAAAIKKGWKTGISFDPVFPQNNYRSEYDDLLAYVFTKLPPEKVHYVSLGVFRMGFVYFERAKKNNSCSLFYKNLERDGNTITIKNPLRTKIEVCFFDALKKYIPEEKILKSSNL